MMSKENTSAIAPITPETIPITYSDTRCCTFGVKRITMAAEMTKAVDPSRLLSLNFFVPKRRPIQTRPCALSSITLLK